MYLIGDIHKLNGDDSKLLVIVSPKFQDDKLEYFRVCPLSSELAYRVTEKIVKIGEERGSYFIEDWNEVPIAAHMLADFVVNIPTSSDPKEQVSLTHAQKEFRKNEILVYRELARSVFSLQSFSDKLPLSRGTWLIIVVLSAVIVAIFLLLAFFNSRKDNTNFDDRRDPELNKSAYERQQSVTIDLQRTESDTVELFLVDTIDEKVFRQTTSDIDLPLPHDRFKSSVDSLVRVNDPEKKLQKERRIVSDLTGENSQKILYRGHNFVEFLPNDRHKIYEKVLFQFHPEAVEVVRGDTTLTFDFRPKQELAGDTLWVKKGKHPQELKVGDYLVFNQFDQLSEARRNQESLQKSGINNSSVGFCSARGYYFVVVATKSPNQAKRLMKSYLDSHSMTDTWILKVFDDVFRF